MCLAQFAFPIYLKNNTFCTDSFTLPYIILNTTYPLIAPSPTPNIIHEIIHVLNKIMQQSSLKQEYIEQKSKCTQKIIKKTGDLVFGKEVGHLKLKRGDSWRRVAIRHNGYLDSAPRLAVNQGFLLTSINCFCDSENGPAGWLKLTASGLNIACRVACKWFLSSFQDATSSGPWFCSCRGILFQTTSYTLSVVIFITVNKNPRMYFSASKLRVPFELV